MFGPKLDGVNCLRRTAALAGYHATHGIVKHTMPSDTWQIVSSVIGAIAVGVTAFARVAAPGPSGRGLARA